MNTFITIFWDQNNQDSPFQSIIYSKIGSSYALLSNNKIACQVSSHLHSSQERLSQEFIDCSLQVLRLSSQPPKEPDEDEERKVTEIVEVPKETPETEHYFFKIPKIANVSKEEIAKTRILGFRRKELNSFGKI